MALTGDIFDRTDRKGEDSTPNGLSATKLEQHNRVTGGGGDGGEPSDGNRDQNDGATTDVSSQIGAAAVAGVTGLVIGGPILGVVAGAGAAYAASRDDGVVGDAARATGELAVDVKDKATKIDEDHNVSGRVGEFFSSFWNKVKGFDEKHDASTKVKETAQKVSEKATKIEQEHHFVERILEGIQGGVKYMLDSLKSATSKDDDAPMAPNMCSKKNVAT